MAVAIPADADDLSRLVEWAGATGTALVPRGAGTGMPGGNVGPGVVVNLVSGLRRRLEIDPDRQLARVEPGFTLRELNEAAGAFGLHFPVDPSSAARCTLGGMLANDSAGAHSVHYGTTRRWTESLEVVLAGGARARVQRGERPADPPLKGILDAIDELLLPDRERILARWPQLRKNSSGYALREYLLSGDAVDLLVGSEGTLALVTGAELRLDPVPPCRGLALLEFTSLERAGEAVQAILELEPAACEILDRTFLDLVRDAGEDPGFPLAPDLQAVLLVEVEADAPDETRARLETIQAHAAGLADRISLADSEAQQAAFWHIRHAASPLIAARTDGRVSMQFIEDGVVPVARLPEYIRALRDTLARHAVPAVIFGHAGDGNLHVNPLVDPHAPGWRARIERIIEEIAEAVAALGGTMAGEHGDGRLRAPLLPKIWGEEMVRRFRAVKQIWDPAGILNPGVILPLPGQRPLDALQDFPPRV